MLLYKATAPTVLVSPVLNSEWQALTQEISLGVCPLSYHILNFISNWGNEYYNPLEVAQYSGYEQNTRCLVIMVVKI
jgi:hypothetical protein